MTILKQQDAIMEKLQTLEQSTDIEINEQLLEE